MGLSFDNNLYLVVAVYFAAILIIFWITMIVWAYRDMRSRSRDMLARLFAGIVVTVLNIPGIFIYLLLRPRETLAEAYERSLEEEALLQEIEEKPTCPGCGQHVRDNWQACAYCHTRLRQPCLHCKYLLELSWTLCPYCATDQTSYQPDHHVVTTSRHVQRMPPEPPPTIPDKWLAQGGTQSQAIDYPRYEDEEY